MQLRLLLSVLLLPVTHFTQSALVVFSGTLNGKMRYVW